MKRFITPLHVRSSQFKLHYDNIFGSSISVQLKSSRVLFQQISWSVLGVCNSFLKKLLVWCMYSFFQCYSLRSAAKLTALFKCVLFIALEYMAEIILQSPLHSTHGLRWTFYVSRFQVQKCQWNVIWSSWVGKKAVVWTEASLLMIPCRWLRATRTTLTIWYSSPSTGNRLHLWAMITRVGRSTLGSQRGLGFGSWNIVYNTTTSPSPTRIVFPPTS